MQNFWKNKKVLVTGGGGFIGSYVVELLLEKDAKVSITTNKGSLANIEHIKSDIEIIKADLRKPDDSFRVTKGKEIILNLASRVAGLAYNISHPVITFNENVEISKNVIDAAHRNGVERFLIVSSACVYPQNCTIPTPESEGFTGKPKPLGYGWAKRVAELLGMFYSSEFGMKVSIARPYNVYGPRDKFDIETSTVISGLIKRVIDGENPLYVWGSGNQTRSFLYVEDCARGLLDITEKYPTADPVNIGSNEEISIRKLAELIVKLSCKSVTLKFDTTKPDGQLRRKCDVKKSKKYFNFKVKTSLNEGLLKAINWYKTIQI